MEDLRVGLETVQVLVFLGAAVAALRLWVRHRTRSAALLGATFTVIGGALLTSRTFPAYGPEPALPLIRDLIVIALATFPWLLALFAWSFEPRFPRWLLASGGAVVGLGAWILWLPPSALDPGPRTPAGATFVAVFLVIWVLLTGAAAIRLWRSGGTQPLVRGRMRVMSVGALLLTAALLVAGSAPTRAGSVVSLVVVAMSIVSALLFVAGFAPPRVLRDRFRGRVDTLWHQMQSELIAASTAEEAAGAVAPVVARLLGGGVAIIDEHGEVIAAARLARSVAEDAAGRIARGEPPASGDEVVEVGRVAMVVRPTAYTPLFGQVERDLVNGFAGQLRLALDRAALFAAEARTRQELERVRDEEQAMIMGLAHDLQGSSNTLGGYTHLLRTSTDDVERAEIMNGIEASTRHFEELVDALVELGRIGVQRSRTDTVDLDEVVRDVLERLEPLHPEARFRHAALPVIAGDRVELGQVFENLFVNAVRHGGSGSRTITVSSEVGPAAVTIHVGDDGQGIAASDRASIFRLFQRGRSAGAAGSGIGLNVVRRIVEAHRGTIELTDQRPGAHFAICFPSPQADSPS